MVADLCLNLCLAQVQLLMEDDDERPPRRRHRNWVAEVNQHRRARGEFFNLVQELRTNDPERHRTYFRMTRETFDLLLSKIGPSITRQRTNFREPIDAAQRLAVTLRYLASGMEFSALAPTHCADPAQHSARLTATHVYCGCQGTAPSPVK